MKVLRIVLCLCVCISALSPAAFADDQHHHDAYDPNHLGHVTFPTSCAPAVQKDFEKGVALLHSFWYEEAEKAFQSVKARDPKCAMAAWGIGMSRWHQLWDAPHGEDMEAARKALESVAATSPKTERERGFVAALRAYYFAADAGNHARAQAYSAAMAKLHQRFPADHEVTVFYALSLLAAAPRGERNIEIRKQAGALLQPIFDAQPNHPGVAHYLIHSYDTPELAQLGLAAARVYAKVAPSAPHALHMPSHIFSRVGMWQESVQSNLASIAATRHSAAMHMGGADHQMHAMDFLQYAYLQMGEDDKAAALMKELDALHVEDDGEMQYTHVTLAVRQALEEHDWKAASAIEVPENIRPWLESTVRCARAIGAARSGNVELAEREVARLTEIESSVQDEDASTAAAIGVTTNRKNAEAWLQHARGNDAEAITEIREAAVADQETGGEGVAAPVAESYAELLLAAGKASDALAQFQHALELAPNRFDSLYGAAVAAEKAGRPQAAQKYFSQLVTVAPVSSRREIVEARAALGKNAAGAGRKTFTQGTPRRARVLTDSFLP